MTTDERIAAISNPNADESSILAAIAAGPLTDEICNAVWDSNVDRAAISSAVLANYHAGLSRPMLWAFARSAGAHRLADAVVAVGSLADARAMLMEAAGDKPPPPELQQALDAIVAADAALDRLIYNRDLGPPAPLRVWY